MLILVGMLVLAAAAWSWRVNAAIERALPAQGQWIEVPGAKLHYVELGADNPGAPLVMIHGILGQIRNFTYDCAERLARDRRVIVVDRPGWGWSGLAGPRPRIPRQGAMIAAFADALGLEAPVLVGHSMGGAVSLAAALHAPGRFGALALIAPYTQPVDRPPAPFRELMVPTWLAPLIAWTLAMPVGIRKGRERAAQVFAPDAAPADFAARGGGMLAMRPKSFLSGVFEIHVASLDMAAQAPRYASLTLPVAILYGREDALLDPELHGRKTADAIPHGRLTLIEGGHMLQICHADETEAWLRGVLSGS
ncbi:MAG: alpha/beta hydrolase [Sphingomonas sp.]|nr:alpha/beta hydrolase [Sphingomonas sp.]